MEKGNSHFKKFCYWMDPEAVETLKKSLSAKGINPLIAEKLPCEALKVDIGIVAPEVWGRNCQYDAAPWYNSSEFNGKFLIVSNSALSENFEKYLETTISSSDFQPQNYPGKNEIKKLALSAKFKSCEPHGWLGFPVETKERLAQAFKNNVGIPDTIEEIFESWDAIHANFMEGKIALTDEGKTIPYTIAETNRTGTCCVELFNIIGAEFREKLVKPCLGAKIMQALEADRYYKVESIKGTK
ncbi:MAG: hypothetical protein HZA77_08540 [Candidatus Schekmanbacteria bacterium]|nr:hypothetical protein [Candidatus Schekmanbacteria bacterium]